MLLIMMYLPYVWMIRSLNRVLGLSRNTFKYMYFKRHSIIYSAPPLTPYCTKYEVCTLYCCCKGARGQSTVLVQWIMAKAQGPLSGTYVVAVQHRSIDDMNLSSAVHDPYNGS